MSPPDEAELHIIRKEDSFGLVEAADRGDETAQLFLDVLQRKFAEDLPGECVSCHRILRDDEVPAAATIILLPNAPFAPTGFICESCCEATNETLAWRLNNEAPDELVHIEHPEWTVPHTNLH